MNFTSLPKIEAQLPEVVVVAVEAETSKTAAPLSKIEDVAQQGEADCQTEKTELPACTPVSANCNSDRRPSAQLLEMLDQQAERRRELSAKFNFNRPYIMIHNDFQMLKQANQWWQQIYKRCYGLDAPKDEIEQKMNAWFLKFPVAKN